MSVTGFEEFEANLRKLKRNNIRLSNKAVKEAATAYDEILTKVTPIGSGIPAGHELNNYEPLAGSIVQTGLKKDHDLSSMIDVGFNTHQGWRVHFPDSGTVDQKAQHFVEQSRKQAKLIVLSIMADYMRKGLNL